MQRAQVFGLEIVQLLFIFSGVLSNSVEGPEMLAQLLAHMIAGGSEYLVLDWGGVFTAKHWLVCPNDSRSSL